MQTIHGEIDEALLERSAVVDDRPDVTHVMLQWRVRGTDEIVRSVLESRPRPADEIPNEFHSIITARGFKDVNTLRRLVILEDRWPAETTVVFEWFDSADGQSIKRAPWVIAWSLGVSGQSTAGVFG